MKDLTFLRKKYPSLVAAAFLFIFFVSLYIYTAAPSIYNGDSGEIAAVVNVLGLAHSTGFPLYILSGKLFTLIFPWGEVAFKLNVYSALLTAASIVFLYFSLRILEISKVSSILTLIIFGLGRHTIWTNAGTANVYTLTLFLSTILIYLYVKWYMIQNKKYIFGYSFLWGLSLGTHPLALIMGIPLVFMLWPEFKIKNIKVAVYSVALSILPLTQYIYLWIAYKRNEIPTLGDVSSLKAFFDYIIQRDWSYKMWDRTLDDTILFIRHLLDLLSSEFSVIFFMAVIMGLGIMWRQSRKFFWVIASMVIGNIIMMYFYGNSRDLYILPRYFFISYMSLAIALAFSFDFFWRQKFFKKNFHFSILIVLILISFSAKLSLSDNNRHNHFIVKNFGNNILNSVPSDSLILVDGDEAGGALLYLQSLGVRNDVVVLHAGIINRDWYIKNKSVKYPNFVNDDILKISNPVARMENILRYNLPKRNMYTIFPSWQGKSSDLETVPVGVIYQVIKSGTNIQNVLVSNKNWQDYQLEGFKIGYYKDKYLNNMVSIYYIVLNDTARAYSSIGYFREAEQLIQKASGLKN